MAAERAPPPVSEYDLTRLDRYGPVTQITYAVTDQLLNPGNESFWATTVHTVSLVAWLDEIAS